MTFILIILFSPLLLFLLIAFMFIIIIVFFIYNLVLLYWLSKGNISLIFIFKFIIDL